MYSKNHTYSVEKLIHYSCGNCLKWWSIGDGPINAELICPNCGFKANIIEVEQSEET